MSQMNVRTLIVGQGVADVMIECAEMVVDLNYGKVSGIQKVGVYGRYPVWLDPSFPDNKVMVTYKADPSDDAANESMVDPWKDGPDGGKWILLSDDQRGQREAHTTTAGRAQRTP